jgi:methanogenic corrinoid protein MtbC1
MNEIKEQLNTKRIMNLNQLYDAILNGRLEEGIASTTAALEEGADPQVIINDYMVKAMEEIGARFEAGTAFVPNLLMSARAMKGVLNLLKPRLASQTVATSGTVVIGTVKGDLHDIGKNLVASMLEGCGFEVVNLGVDVSSEQFVAAAREHHADIVCMSALLTTTMNYMREVTAAIQASDLLPKPRIMVGGAPLTEAFAREIGADGYSSNANGAVILARRLVNA